MGTVFGSEKVITQHISKSDLKAYFVGFDINDANERYYRLNELVNLMEDVIPEFAFGHHEGKYVLRTKTIGLVREAARSIYRIKDFEEVKKIYVSGGSISDDDISKKYLKRGEFGELLLHLLLRDFHNTIPLLSKIYFKDAYNATTHGFDAVHVQPESSTLWLGEAKLYDDGKKGLKALIEDIKEHFKRDYLNSEFAIISKKLKPYDNIYLKNRWLSLMDEKTKLIDLFRSINIPLLCTYTSPNFTKYNDEHLTQFISDYNAEINDLKKYFDDNNDSPVRTNLNTILLLFPVQSKKDLVKSMHEKLSNLQMI